MRSLLVMLLVITIASTAQAADPGPATGGIYSTNPSGRAAYSFSWSYGPVQPQTTTVRTSDPGVATAATSAPATPVTTAPPASGGSLSRHPTEPASTAPVTPSGPAEEPTVPNPIRIPISTPVSTPVATAVATARPTSPSPTTTTPPSTTRAPAATSTTTRPTPPASNGTASTTRPGRANDTAPIENTTDHGPAAMAARPHGNGSSVNFSMIDREYEADSVAHVGPSKKLSSSSASDDGTIHSPSGPALGFDMADEANGSHKGENESEESASGSEEANKVSAMMSGADRPSFVTVAFVATMVTGLANLL